MINWEAVSAVGTIILSVITIIITLILSYREKPVFLTEKPGVVQTAKRTNFQISWRNHSQINVYSTRLQMRVFDVNFTEIRKPPYKWQYTFPIAPDYPFHFNIPIPNLQGTFFLKASFVGKYKNKFFITRTHRQSLYYKVHVEDGNEPGVVVFILESAVPKDIKRMNSTR